jgi:uncharacterized damage-inducible protein DinB
MKYTLLFAALILTFSAVAQSNKTYLTEIQTKWANAKAYTLAVADAMPAERYGFRPVADEMPFAEQMIHLSSNMVWLSSSYLSTEKSPFTTKEMAAFSNKSKAEIRDIVEQSMDYAMNAVKNLPPDQLNEPVKFFSGPMSKRQIIMLMNDHLTHHRAQSIVYLRLNFITPPKYVGW